MKKSAIPSLFSPSNPSAFRGVLTTGLIMVLLICAQSGYSQSKLLNKMIAKVAKKTGSASTVSTPTLDDIQPTVGIGSNLYPTELGTISQAFFNDWITGGQQTFIMFTKKNSPGFYKIDGSVKFNGQEIEFVTAGMYSIIGGTSGSPRKVDISTSSGQKASFVIEPSKNPIKLISINGSKKDNVSLDLTKDVVLEVEGIPAAGNPVVKVSIAINQAAIKSIYDVCFVRGGSTLTIPAAAFRNINIIPAGDALYGFKKSFLAVSTESVENATDVSGSFTSVQYVSSYSDGKFITVTTEPELNKGLTAKGTENLKDGAVDYDFFKPNAFMSRPSSQMKKIGVVSFGISGKTFSSEGVIVQEKDVTKDQAQITKTTTLTFPKQDDARWNAVLEKLYPQLTEIVQQELGATVLPIDAATKTAGYKSIESFSTADSNTKEGFSKAYKSTKLLNIPPFSEGYGVNAANEKIMKESGADALLSLTLDLQVQKDGDFGMMVPTLSFEIVGKINGLATNTKYFAGKTTGKGIPSEDIGFEISYTGEGSGNFGKPTEKKIQTVGEITPEELDKIIRSTDLLTVFRKGLKEIIAKEKANSDYETVWNLQK